MCAPHSLPMSKLSHCVKLRAPEGGRHYPHHAAIGVLGVARADSLGDYRTLSVFAHVDHLGAGIRLLVVVHQRDGVELADRIVAPGESRSDTSR